MNRQTIDYKTLGTVWFTSDTHYGHANVIKYCNRPYADVDAMNAGLTALHNSVVGPGDTLIHIGDFAMGNRKLWPSHMARLNGARKILACGNHDSSATAMIKVGFTEAYGSIVLTNTPYGDILCEHVPNRLHGHAYMLCGHVHEQWTTLSPNIINVGVDVNGYKPVSLDALIAKL